MTGDKISMEDTSQQMEETLKAGEPQIAVEDTGSEKVTQFLSDLVIHTKYANFMPNQKRRQTWAECVNETREMHKRKYPYLAEEIDKVFDDYVLTKKVLPSMRSIQFGGLPIEFGPNRIYNCSYAPIDHPFVFAEMMFLLLGGTGVGYSVRKRHIKKLPPIVNPQGSRRYLIGDSIEGWSDSIRQLVYAYMKGKELPIFDYRDIRPEGSLIKKTGGRAPGSKKLQECHKNIDSVLKNAIGRKLTDVEAHDIVCFLADCILAGGVREAALISLFDIDSMGMMTCKSNFKCEGQEIQKAYDEKGDTGYWVKFKLSKDQENNTNVYDAINGYIFRKISTKYGTWDLDNFKDNGIIPFYILHPQRSRANNSVSLRRGDVSKEQFMSIWQRTKDSMAGEPGIYWTNDDDDGTNPCCEIALKPNQFCNLTTAVVYDVDTQEELNNRVKAATFIGTLQAGYTDFHYLRTIWRETTEKEALLGVSMTGIASGKVLNLDLKQAAFVARIENEGIAAKIGIKPAARISCIKPEGSGTLAAGVVGSGIHAVHDYYFIRNNRIKKSDPTYEYLMKVMPEFIETDTQNPDKAVISMPIKAPKGVITRDESSIDMLERIKKFSQEWVLNGHRSGVNTHNVSATVSIREHEWEETASWMWDNRSSYSGLSVLPYSGGVYQQAPFIAITEDHYNDLIKRFPNKVDFTQIEEEFNQSNHVSENLACSGSGCEI